MSADPATPGGVRSASLSDTGRRRAFLVLGMHRTGTSALTRTLNLLGAELPEDLMQPGPDNVQGFWESQFLMELHEELLGSAGTSWRGLTPVPAAWYESNTARDFKSRLRAFVEREFEFADLFVLKDPRISLFMPLWLDVLGELEIEALPVLVLRNPLEVSASLAARNSLSFAHSCYLWLRYMLDGEVGTRSLRRSIVRYDALLADWVRQTRRVYADLGLPWSPVPPTTSRRIGEFLSPKHRHHSTADEEVRDDKRIPAWIADAYELLARLVGDPHDETALAGLDEIRRHFTTASALFMPLLSEAGPMSSGTDFLAAMLKEMQKEQRRETAVLRSELAGLRDRMAAATERTHKVEQRLKKARDEKRWLATQLYQARTHLISWVRRSGELAIDLRAAVSNPVQLADGLGGWLRTCLKLSVKLLGIDLDSRRIYKIVGGSGLFDATFYARQLPITERNVRNLLRHFLKEGSLAGLRPNPVFDPTYYLRRYPDVARSGLNPLGHYIVYGARDGRAPNALFDTRFYLDTYPEVAVSGENPLAHYLRTGGHELRCPHPLFDPTFYRTEYPEVARRRLNPLVDYLTRGLDEPLRPNAAFDPVRYLEEHPELRNSKITPLEHFAEFGDWSPKKPLSKGALLTVGEEGDGGGELSITRWGMLADPSALDRNAKLNHLLNEFAALVSREPQVTIVIPVFNQLDFTVHCLWSLCHFRNSTPFEVIVVNDCSTDETKEVLSLVRGLRILDNETNSGFVVSCNNGAASARGELTVLLNNDTAVIDGWLDELVDVYRRLPEAGMVGSQLLYPDGTLQEAGCVVWKDGSAWNIGRDKDPGRPEYNYLRDTHYCSGSSLMVPTALYNELDGFDLALRPGYYEDIDLAYRIREAGRRVLYQPRSRLIHFEGKSGFKRHQAINREKFKRKWARALTEEKPETVPLYTVDCNGATAQVLFIEPTILTPDQDAGSAMSFNLIRALVEQRMKVTFVAAENFPYDARYTRLLEREGVECLYRPYYQSLADVFSARPDAWDLVFIARLHCITEVFDEVQAANPSAKLIYQTIDLSFVRQRRELELGLYEGTRASVDEKEETELRYIEACDKSIIVSSFERDLLASRGMGDKVVSMPLLSYDYPPPKLSGREGVMFIGGFRHRPNLDAVEYLAEEIAPRVLEMNPNLVFYIVGGDVPDELLKLASSNLVFVGQIRNPDSFFLGMRLSVAPLRYGAGIKGKVIQSLAAGLPCVGTSIAAEGIGESEETGLWIADDAADFARGILTFASDDETWRVAAERGYRFAQERYAPKALHRDVKSFVETIL